MTERAIVAKELANVLSVFAHPHRIQIVEELRNGEQDVNHIKDELGISQARASQHLAVLRTHHLVEERREGRHVFYHLTQPRVAEWLLDGLEFIKYQIRNQNDMLGIVKRAEDKWT